MNPAVRALLEGYDAHLASLGMAPLRTAGSERPSPGEGLQHARWMVRRLLEDAEAEGWSVRKVNRWLGFLQGALWFGGVRGIPGLRDDSRHLYEDPPVQVEPPTP